MGKFHRPHLWGNFIGHILLQSFIVLCSKYIQGSYSRIHKVQSQDWIYFELHRYRMLQHNNTRTIHTLQWRHNELAGVSNHQPHECLRDRLFTRRSKKTWKLSVTGLCVWGIHRAPVNSPHKGPVTRKMFRFDDVIMISTTVRPYEHHSVSNLRQIDWLSNSHFASNVFKCIFLCTNIL